MANRVTKDELISCVMSKIQEFDLNIQEFSSIKTIIAILDLI